ncbi:MAG: 5-(carboxyamino)imidazole ribonucleotide mutase [Clostridiales bacterium]|nr:MAG: 5-(carboxyamino)imidazole ribonucleotide mutase [Clostridiales bacterium]
MKKVAIIMGSDSDLPVLEPAFDILKQFNISFEVHVYSAHRTPETVLEFSRNAYSNDIGVIIAAAGKAAHLAGVIASHTAVPVIGVPVKSSTLDGMDALLSTVQMPGGVPVATVAINGSKNAALLACEILSLSDETLMERILEFREIMMADVLKKNDEVFKKYSNL